jgi:predicted ATP-dependent protease
MPQTLPPAALTLQIDPASLGFNDTSELITDDPIWVGQARAEKAARFGLSIEQADYNLFVLGEVGSGRSSLLYRVMQEVAARRPPAPDLVYLYNFAKPEKPIALRLLTGQGRALRTRMEAFSRDITAEIPHKLDEEGYRLDCARARKGYQAEIEQAYAELAALAASWNYALRREDGRLVFNLLDREGKAMQEEHLLGMRPEERVALEKAEEELRAAIGAYLEKIRPKERAMEQALTALRHRTIEPLVRRLAEGLHAGLAVQPGDQQRLEAWVEQLIGDVLANLEAFVPPPAANEDTDHDRLLDQLARYRVNLVVDNAEAAGAPALRDDDPIFRSLFGGVEYQAESGVLLTDFTHIRGGNLVRAHGGFLMLHLTDLLRDPQVWEKLQRFLRNGRLQIEEPAAAAGQMAATTLEPEALDIDVKIVLICTRDEYYQLQELDPELCRHFRAKVDFAETMPADAATRRTVALFCAQTCRRLGLPHLEAGAVARLLLDMQREVDDRHRLSAVFGQLESWLVESASVCRARGGELVSAVDVDTAAQARIERHNYPEESLHEAVEDGEIVIAVEGERVGQINGLTQIDLGDYRFGSPVRITAHAYPGEDGIMNVDREVEMSGPNHDKGVFILQHWLAATFSGIAPLCLSASLVFEQEYHGVEGDSASCAELFALLSALSGVGLPQGIAVTGALNQHGEVLPIGGLNEKIEGYFRICRRLGLNGKQGVIIPARNQRHLLLNGEVVRAVEQGMFSIRTMETVQDGIAQLTGMAAGIADDAGRYPPDSVLGRVQRTLQRFRKACDQLDHHPRDKDHA